MSQVTPFFKEGNKADVSNYRPIGLLCYSSEVFEKVVFDVVYEPVRKALHENEFGFRDRRSVTLQFLIFLHEIYKDNDAIATDHLALLYLDFAKAFDTVPHARLINKLANFGIGGKLLKLLSLCMAPVCQSQLLIIEHSLRYNWCPSGLHSRPAAVSAFH